MDGMVGWVRRLWWSLLYLLLGGTLLVPVIAGLAVVMMKDLGTTLLIAAAATPIAAFGMAGLPIVRRIEVIALRELLKVQLPEHPQTGPIYLLCGLHLLTGAVFSALILVVAIPVVMLTQVTPLSVIAGVLAVLTVALPGELFRRAAARFVVTDPHHVIADLGRRDILAQELHDSIGHALSVITVQAAAAKMRTDDPAISHILSAAASAQNELDQMLAMLRDQKSPDAPDLTALPGLLAGLDVDGHVAPTTRVRPSVSRVAYRIIQEGLSNALRHGAGATTLHVSTDNDLEIHIGNDIAGSGDRSSGYGIVGMTQRARLVGGSCVCREVNGRWHLTARLPL